MNFWWGLNFDEMVFSTAIRRHTLYGSRLASFYVRCNQSGGVTTVQTVHFVTGCTLVNAALVSFTVRVLWSFCSLTRSNYFYSCILGLPPTKYTLICQLNTLTFVQARLALRLRGFIAARRLGNGLRCHCICCGCYQSLLFVFSVSRCSPFSHHIYASRIDLLSFPTR